MSSLAIYESDEASGRFHAGCGACGWHSYGLPAAEKARLRVWMQLHKAVCPEHDPRLGGAK